VPASSSREGRRGRSAFPLVATARSRCVAPGSLGERADVVRSKRGSEGRDGRVAPFLLVWCVVETVNCRNLRGKTDPWDKSRGAR
jgi:hypothetical protein